MKYGVVTAPTLEPVSLAEFKDHARVAESEADGLLAGYILTARQWAESLTGRMCMQQTLDAYYDEFDCEMDLPRGPAQSITSVSYVDTAGATQTVSSTYYLLDSKSRINAVTLVVGYAWPCPDYRPNAVTIRYVAGYGTNPGTVPEQIRHAILMYARFLYDGNEADRICAEGLLADLRVYQ